MSSTKEDEDGLRAQLQADLRRLLPRGGVKRLAALMGITYGAAKRLYYDHLSDKHAAELCRVMVAEIDKELSERAEAARRHAIKDREIAAIRARFLARARADESAAELLARKDAATAWNAANGTPDRTLGCQPIKTNSRLPE